MSILDRKPVEFSRNDQDAEIRRESDTDTLKKGSVIDSSN